MGGYRDSAQTLPVATPPRAKLLTQRAFGTDVGCSDCGLTEKPSRNCLQELRKLMRKPEQYRRYPH
jgi:hypothetical protein